MKHGWGQWAHLSALPRYPVGALGHVGSFVVLLKLNGMQAFLGFSALTRFHLGMRFRGSDAAAFGIGDVGDTA